METYRGLGIGDGVGVGRVHIIGGETYCKREAAASEEAPTSPSEQWADFCAARARAVQSLEELALHSREDWGVEQAAIFEVQAMMLQDADFAGAVRREITAGADAARAVQRAMRETVAQFEGMNDPYLRERATDVKNIAQLLIEQLRGEVTDQSVGCAQTPCIVCAIDLSPAQTARLDRNSVRGFITAHGSLTSHTAILARSMGIPALLGVGEAAIAAMREGMEVALDASTGTCYLSPDEHTLRALREQQQLLGRTQQKREQYRGQPTRTADGQTVRLYANAALPADVEGVLAADAEGIGLFRSEFLYLDRATPPSEEEQYGIYREILEGMQGRRVIVRTLDIGADKQAACLPMSKREENPALGCRAVRHSLLHPSLFLTQARALLRAARYGALSVMFPLISSEQELRGVLALWERAKDEVGHVDGVELGIMIETPAAALISDRLAQMVDFFSIGTNDLTQYTLAMDRQNEALQPFYQPHHPAILSLIRMTVESARAAGIWVGICGELGADASLTEEFVRMGIDELSVAPSQILSLREKIAGITASRSPSLT